MKNRKIDKGSGVVEYILITALMALALVAVFRTFRADISRAYEAAGNALVQGVQESLVTDQPAP